MEHIRLIRALFAGFIAGCSGVSFQGTSNDNSDSGLSDNYIVDKFDIDSSPDKRPIDGPRETSEEETSQKDSGQDSTDSTQEDSRTEDVIVIVDAFGECQQACLKYLCCDAVCGFDKIPGSYIWICCKPFDSSCNDIGYGRFCCME